MHLHISKDLEHLSEDAAAWMTDFINETLKKQETFSLVLSGGNTPKKLHALLASDAYKSKIEWERIHIFWGDERFVPLNDEHNNAKMAFDTLLNFVPIKKQNIHIIQTENISPEISAEKYEDEIKKYFLSTANYHPSITFDLVLLGMGDDGHTLSLFPGMDEIIFEEKKYCTSIWLQSQNMYRITLTSVVANRSKAIAFLVLGASKAKALHEVLYGNYSPSIYPSQIIKPSNGELYWFTDEAAMGA